MNCFLNDLKVFMFTLYLQIDLLYSLLNPGKNKNIFQIKCAMKLKYYLNAEIVCTYLFNWRDVVLVVFFIIYYYYI